MSKKQEKYAFLFQHPAGSCMQREECLVTLWVFICFLTHMLRNYTGPSIPFPHPPKPQCYGARSQQGSPLVRNILVLAMSSLPSTHQPFWHKGFVLNMTNDFCRFLSTRHARGMPGPPEEVGPPSGVKGSGLRIPNFLFCALTPASRHFARGSTRAANSWTSEQEGCPPVADTGLADTFPGLGR